MAEYSWVTPSQGLVCGLPEPAGVLGGHRGPQPRGVRSRHRWRQTGDRGSLHKSPYSNTWRSSSGSAAQVYRSGSPAASLWGQPQHREDPCPRPRTPAGPSTHAAARRDDRRQPEAGRRAVRRPRGGRRRRGRAAPDLRRTRRRGRAGGPRPARARRREGRPGRHLGAEHCSSGSSCSTPPPGSARSSSTSTRPTAPTRSATCCGQAGIAHAGLRAVVQDQRLPGDDRRGPARPAGAAGRRLPRRGHAGTRCSPTARARATPRRSPSRAAPAGLRRPDQHPVHVGHDRVPEGRDAVAPQHPQQRLLRRRGLRLHASRTGSACRCPSTTASAW